jgi:hypothetical protein
MSPRAGRRTPGRTPARRHARSAASAGAPMSIPFTRPSTSATKKYASSPLVNGSLRSRTIDSTANRPKPTPALTSPAVITTSARNSPTLNIA